MQTKLSFNWMSYHIDNRDWEIIRSINPPYPKVFNNFWGDPFAVERLLESISSPIVFRDHPLSEEKAAMMSDPEGTGRRHAESWANLVATKFSKIKNWNNKRAIFLGINEPNVGTPDERSKVVSYTVAFLDTLRSHGLRGGALNLSVGWPNNTGIDYPVDWQPFTAVKEAIERGNHILFVHEYWGPQGPMHNWGWWAGRLGQCPWNVPIVVGECGIDHGVIDGNLIGWQAYVSKEDYLKQIIAYEKEMQRDDRVQALEFFCYDFAHPWASFDVRPMREELLTYVHELDNEPHPALKVIPYYPPNVRLPVPTPTPSATGIRLRIPYVSQLGDTATYASGDCGMACATALIQEFINPKQTVDQSSQEAGLPRGYRTTHLTRDISPYLSRKGIGTTYKSYLTTSRMREALDNKQSLILLVWYPYLIKRYDESYQNGHYITVHGYEVVGDTTYFFYDDPYWMTSSSGEDIRISATDLQRAMNKTGIHSATPAQGLQLSSHQLRRVGEEVPVSEPLRLEKLVWHLEETARRSRTLGDVDVYQYLINKLIPQIKKGVVLNEQQEVL